MGGAGIAWMAYYFLGSMVAAVLGLKLFKGIFSPFFMVTSLFTRKPPSSSDSGR